MSKKEFYDKMSKLSKEDISFDDTQQPSSQQHFRPAN